MSKLSPEGGETLVFSTKSKNEAEKIRKEINSNFSRVWVYVFNVGNKKWEVKVANNWGGKLDKEILSKIKDFIKDL